MSLIRKVKLSGKYVCTVNTSRRTEKGIIVRIQMLTQLLDSSYGDKSLESRPRLTLYCCFDMASSLMIQTSTFPSACAVIDMFPVDHRRRNDGVVSAQLPVWTHAILLSHVRRKTLHPDGTIEKSMLPARDPTFAATGTKLKPTRATRFKQTADRCYRIAAAASSSFVCCRVTIAPRFCRVQNTGCGPLPGASPSRSSILSAKRRGTGQCRTNTVASVFCQANGAETHCSYRVDRGGKLCQSETMGVAEPPGKLHSRLSTIAVLGSPDVTDWTSSFATAQRWIIYQMLQRAIHALSHCHFVLFATHRPSLLSLDRCGCEE